MRGAFVLSLSALAALSPVPASAQAKFVGVKACAQCHDATAHGNALTTWLASPHANAFATLVKSAESAPRECGDIRLWVVRLGGGQRYGLPTPATEAKECLPCHTTAFGAGAEMVASTFERSAGVQCETCHGPGSAHADAMRAGGEASAAGLTAYADEAAIQKRCARCHDGTCGTLDFATMWPKVRHATRRGR